MGSLVANLAWRREGGGRTESYLFLHCHSLSWSKSAAATKNNGKCNARHGVVSHWKLSTYCQTTTTATAAADKTKSLKQCSASFSHKLFKENLGCNGGCSAPLSLFKVAPTFSCFEFLINSPSTSKSATVVNNVGQLKITPISWTIRHKSKPKKAES